MGQTGGARMGGVGLMTDVKVADRPMTQMGVGKARGVATAGPGRQIYDKSTCWFWYCSVYQI